MLRGVTGDCQQALCVPSTIAAPVGNPRPGCVPARKQPVVAEAKPAHAVSGSRWLNSREGGRESPSHSRGFDTCAPSHPHIYPPPHVANIPSPLRSNTSKQPLGTCPGFLTHSRLSGLAASNAHSSLLLLRPWRWLLG